MTLLLYVSVLGLLSQVYGNTVCEDGWMAFKGSCYLFATRMLDFTQAEQHCRQHFESKLIQINSREENAFIRDRLRELKPTNWWLGMTDDFIEGYWKWTDQTQASVLDWYVGQPSGDGDCALFFESFDFQWSDTSCTDKHYPICEIRMAS